MTDNVKTFVVGYGAILLPDPGVTAIVMSQAQSEPAGATLLGVSVNGQLGMDTRALLIDDHSGAYIRDVNFERCAIGIEIKGTSYWSESSTLDNAYINDCGTHIKFNKAGGTGSFGYSSWGLVHCDNIGRSYAGATGFEFPDGCNFFFSQIASLVMHIAGADAVGMRIGGQMTRNCRLKAIFEGFGVATSRYGIDLEPTADVTGAELQVSFAGTWTQRIRNPSNREYLRTDAGRDFQVRATTADAYRCFVDGEAFPRTAVRPGRIMLGDGAAPPDVSLLRPGPGVAAVDAELGLFANTQFMAKFTHVNSGNRTYTLPNTNGNIPSVSAGATNMTQGFNFIPSAPGTPSGIPMQVPAGTVPMQHDSASNRLYIFSGGVWRYATLT